MTYVIIFYSIGDYMKNERVRRAIRLLVVLAILTVIVFVWDLFKNRNKSINDIINIISPKQKNTDNSNGIYSYIEPLGVKYNASKTCGFDSITNYIYIIYDEYYYFRSTCMGTFLKEKGQTKNLNIDTDDNGYYVMFNKNRYVRDNKLKVILPINLLKNSKETDIDLNSLSIITKETQFEGSYYKLSKTVAYISPRMTAIYEHSPSGGFKLTLGQDKIITYEYTIKDMNMFPSVRNYGSNLAIIEKEYNEFDKNKYAYKLKLISATQNIYDLRNHFPIMVDGVQLNTNDYSIYIMYDDSKQYYRMFVGYDKKFCVGDEKSNKIAYYEFAIKYNFLNATFDRPEFVKIGYENEDCSYIEQYVRG